MWDLWRNEGGMERSESQRAKFADPEVRRRSVALLEQARDLDEKAANHIEAALKPAR
jgi:hypothetical protein